MIKKRGLLIKKKVPNNDIFLSFFALCSIKRHPFPIKNFLFHQNFPFFFSMVSVDHISFARAVTSQLHVKWQEICANIPKQICFSTILAKRRREPCTVSGPQGKSELYVQRADSTSDHWSLSLRRERKSL